MFSITNQLAHLQGLISVPCYFRISLSSYSGSLTHVISLFKRCLNLKSIGIYCLITLNTLKTQHYIVKRSWALETKGLKFKGYLTIWIALGEKYLTKPHFANLHTYHTVVTNIKRKSFNMCLRYERCSKNSTYAILLVSSSLLHITLILFKD